MIVNYCISKCFIYTSKKLPYYLHGGGDNLFSPLFYSQNANAMFVTKRKLHFTLTSNEVNAVIVELLLLLKM
jgi:hypothetical protein